MAGVANEKFKSWSLAQILYLYLNYLLWPVNLQLWFLLYLNLRRCKHLFLSKPVDLTILELVELDLCIFIKCVARNECSLCYFTSVEVFSRIVYSMSSNEHL